MFSYPFEWPCIRVTGMLKRTMINTCFICSSHKPKLSIDNTKSTVHDNSKVRSQNNFSVTPRINERNKRLIYRSNLSAVWIISVLHSFFVLRWLGQHRLPSRHFFRQQILHNLYSHFKPCNAECNTGFKIII